MHYAARTGHVEIMRKSNGARVNAMVTHLLTPREVAAAAGKLDEFRIALGEK
jgi:hypothetical protein